jgi:hypothetical protein
MSDDARLIRSHIPSRHDLLAGYLSFLETNRHIEAAGGVAKDLAGLAEAADVPFLTDYCGRALAYNSEAPAASDASESSLAVWNTMCRRKLLTLSPLNPVEGKIVGDPEFASFPAGGFGWRLAAPEGVTVSPAGEAGGIRIVFSGNQPEDCVLMNTELPVKANTRYRLKYNSSYEKGAAVSGLSWEVLSSHSGAPILSASDFPEDSLADSPAKPGPATVDFETDSENVAQLRLRYRRPVGSMRARGAVIVQSVRSELAP